MLNLDGAGDFVTFGSQLIPASGSFSVLVTAKLNFVGTPGSIYEMISQGNCCGAFYIGASPSGIRVGDTWPIAYGTFPADGDWHTFAVVVTAGTSPRLFIDGAPVNTLGSEISHATGGINTQLGRQYNSGENWPGQLDEVRIYTGALTDGEVAGLVGPSLTSVPEPWSLTLTAAGLLAVGLRRRVRAGNHHVG